MEKEIDRIEAMIIMGKYEIPKMVFDKVMQEGIKHGIKEGRKQLAEDYLNKMKLAEDFCKSSPNLTVIYLKKELQKELQ